MVDDVALDDAVEEVAADEAKVAVDRGERALDKGPAVGLEVRDIRVGVVQVGDGDFVTLLVCWRMSTREGGGEN